MYCACRISKVRMKNGGATIDIFNGARSPSREVFRYSSGAVTIESDELTFERALFLLERTRLDIWEILFRDK